MKVLLLGADGFIGRHIAFHLRGEGIEVLAQARRTKALEAMGFAILRADLTNAATHEPAFWRPHLDADTHIINAAGLLTGTDAAFQAVHVLAPTAAYAARQPGTRVLLISAVGVEADTPFGRWRRQGEVVASAAEATILRAGLVLADTSYGGSSLVRALAALPCCTPVVGDGEQPFNPIHATDLAAVVLECLQSPPGPGIWQIAGPQIISQAELIQATQNWLGRSKQPLLHLPMPIARRLGWLGDMLKIGPISATSVAQLEQGVVANPAPLLARLCCKPRPFSQFLNTRPAGTQDLWQARLYLLKPLIRLTLAALWLVSAGLGLLTPPQTYLPLIQMPAMATVALAWATGLADAAIGAALLRNWRPKTLALLQIIMVVCYTLGLSVIAPALWLDPFGGLLKNLPILALLLAHLALVEER